MVNAALELVGFLLVLAFCLVVWWPAALLVGGLGLIATAIANERAEARRPVDELIARRAERSKAAA
jgi:hypothetical protein